MGQSSTSLDTMSNIKKSSICSTSNFSGTLPQTKKEVLVEQKTHRKSTMGFFYQGKPHKLSFNNINSPNLKYPKTSRAFIEEDGQIIEEPHHDIMKATKKWASELEKMRNFQNILHNKELKSKEQELCKLLRRKFDSGEQKYLQSISNMKINCTNATASFSDYFSSPKKMTPRPPTTTTNVNQKNIFFSCSRHQEKRKLMNSPYHPRKEFNFEWKNQNYVISSARK